MAGGVQARGPAVAMTGTVDRPMVKCVVWDLDDTLWDGVLAEDGRVVLRAAAVHAVRALDERGILQSIASKNDPRAVREQLDHFALTDYFLFPQASWDAKSVLLRRIAKEINIGVDTLLFIDDSPFERAEVASALPVRCVDAADVAILLDRPDLTPAIVTADGAQRRVRYRQDARRREYEDGFTGPRNEFLRSLDIRLSVRAATPDDLARAAELTVRTNQLNTTGLTFSREQLLNLMARPENTLLVVSLRDVFGEYGTVGLVMLTASDDQWRIRLLLMSCRVMGRNVGGAVISHLAAQADQRGLRLTADFRHTDVNRPMYTVYRLAGFSAGQSTDKAAETVAGQTLLLELAADAPRTRPAFLTLTTD
ncbi:HAD-IIIC family phosphatase [Catenulispora sp. NL8]|uniref:HAD-IIIC family phosphatase n=1 Tax=Catenulispora pinistramenti TaxID=2705254 RepID=A0ABS5KR91_9ACTN|nr:HAD-IIIC family phosphatase [Catenulispora pinistramenti]MBS2548566.1 HAD-IIIC family phosphatase [Catenulispora pinistramenti]